MLEPERPEHQGRDEVPPVSQDAPRRFTKQALPTKTCLVCGRPFAWRKQWSRVWDDVKYCSDKCRASKPTLATEVTATPRKT